MKRNLLSLMVLPAMFFALSNTISAQTIEERIATAMASDMSTWSFSSSRTNINGIYYNLDETNGLAQVSYYTSSNVASDTLTIPETISYNSKDYVVVSMQGYYGYNQKTTQIVLPKTMRRLGDYAFYGYNNVRRISIPETVEVLGSAVFQNWTNQTIVFNSTTVPTVEGSLTGSSSYHIKLIVPAASFRAYHLTDYIEDQCVIANDMSVSTVVTGKVDNGELGYVVVADALPEVRTYSDVNKLVISEGTIDETDWAAIRKMPNLIELDLSGLSIEDIPYQALYQCWQVEKVILPPTTKSIRGYAFYQTGIKDFIIPDSVRNITGSYNFYDCDSLVSLKFPEGITYLPDNVCQDCNKLQHIQLPSTLSGIGSYAFYSCDLQTLSIPGALKAISYYSFANNSNMYYVQFGEGIKRIEDYAFSNCSSIGQFDNATELTDEQKAYGLIFPSTLRYIGNYAFNRDTSVKSIFFNEGLEEIYYYSFNGCTGLTEITLPSSLQYCNYTPFSGCSNIKKIEARSLIPPTVRSRIITSSAGNIDLYVPLWSFQEYMTTPGWLEFQDHTHIITDNLPENIVINKDFEFVLNEDENVKDYRPNIRMLYNSEEIDDGFGNKKYERGNLTISSRSKLAINDFSMYVSPYAKYYADESYFYGKRNYDSYRTTYNPNSLVVRGDMRAENQKLNLMLYNDTWQFITFPFDVNMKDIVPVDTTTQWVIRKYSGEKRAAQKFDSTWVNLTSADILEAGKGYIMMCYNRTANSNAPVEFTVSPIINSLTRQYLFTTEDRVVPLEENLSEFEQNRSWNLVGNPYPCYFDTRYLDTEAPFMVWDSYNRAYAALSPIDDSYILNPGESFFIQRPVNESTLTFLRGGRQTYRNPNDLTVKEAKAFKRNGSQTNVQRYVFNIALSAGEFSDRTRVVFNADASIDYELSRDAAKFMSSDNLVPQIWTIGKNAQYAINERPESDGIVQLAVHCGNKGIYTISLGENSAKGNVVLEDCLKNIKTTITADEGYTFTAEAGTVTNRFYLHFSEIGSDVNGINSVAVQSDNKNEATYNLSGQRVDKDQKGIIIRKGHKTLNK